jgi:predicted DCC family thiol-disulfide oxidoreductase YuxK
VEDVAQLGGRLLVVFDGHCGLCNGTVRWLLRRDQLDRLRFLASVAPTAARLLARSGLMGSEQNTIVVVCGAETPEPKAFVRSTAVAALLAELPQPWPFWSGVLRAIPRPLRDLGYRSIARVRYRVWGRLESCPLPTAEERWHFL